MPSELQFAFASADRLNLCSLASILDLCPFILNFHGLVFSLVAGALSVGLQKFCVFRRGFFELVLHQLELHSSAAGGGLELVCASILFSRNISSTSGGLELVCASVLFSWNIASAGGCLELVFASVLFSWNISSASGCLELVCASVLFSWNISSVGIGLELVCPSVHHFSWNISSAGVGLELVCASVLFTWNISSAGGFLELVCLQFSSAGSCLELVCASVLLSWNISSAGVGLKLYVYQLITSAGVGLELVCPSVHHFSWSISSVGVGLELVCLSIHHCRLVAVGTFSHGPISVVVLTPNVRTVITEPGCLDDSEGSWALDDFYGDLLKLALFVSISSSLAVKVERADFDISSSSFDKLSLKLKLPEI
ncbi:glycosyltransferase family protein 47 [Perilla frutescens var. frutescens]|nr:glycosyltransferase family protein 47 [Perilla frutescens var. frutescens]